MPPSTSPHSFSQPYVVQNNPPLQMNVQSTYLHKGVEVQLPSTKYCVLTTLLHLCHCQGIALVNLT